MNEKQVYENQETAIKLLKENVELKTRINKAIEYIECGKTFNNIETARIIDKYEKILLEILKGEQIWKH